MTAPTTEAAVSSLALGVAAGLVAALASAISYLVSRHHGGPAGARLRLLVSSHAVMGLACLPLAWFLSPATWPPARAWVPPLVASAVSYLAGQAGVFAALARAPASRLAPLLGLKIVVLAGIVTLLPGDGLDLRQWLAVALSVVAAAILQRAGGIGGRTFLIVLFTCLAFAISDLCIVALIDALGGAGDATGRPLGRLHAGGLAMAITYVACGLLAAGAIALRPSLGPQRRGDGAAASQYAAAWLASMVALYACFGLVGAVLGNILQSTRGVMAIVMGAWLARAGWHELEERVDRATLLRRITAAVLMVAAIALFVADVSGRKPKADGETHPAQPVAARAG